MKILYFSFNFHSTEENFPGIRLEAESYYFVQDCQNLTGEEQKQVKVQFADILNKEDICKSRKKKPLCEIKDIGIICGRTTRRRRSIDGSDIIESSVDFSFNVTALENDPTTEDCQDICDRLGLLLYPLLLSNSLT